MSTLREKIQAAPSYRHEIVRVDAWDVEVECRSMKVGQVARFQKAAAGKANENKGIDEKTLAVLKEGVYDPQTGEPVFRDSDLGLLRELDPEPVNDLVETVLRLSGLTEEEEKATGN